MAEATDFVVKSLGHCRVDSPLATLLSGRRQSINNVDGSDRVLFDDIASIAIARGLSVTELPGSVPTGPRKMIYFGPSKTRAGIVTCGGLCRSFNDVIRALVMELTFRYGVRKITGFCNGYQGFIARHGDPVVELTPDRVSHINSFGTCRGDFFTQRSRPGQGDGPSFGLYCVLRRTGEE